MAELVGGAFISALFNVLLDRLSSPEFINLVQGKKLDQKLLRRLRRILYVVQALLNDADRKQITDPAVKEWLADLEDTVYVADDLLDEVHTKAAIAQSHPGNLWSRCFKSNLQDSKIVAKIEEIIDTLEDIAKHKDILGLKNISTEVMSQRIPSTSLVEKSDICGRDKDKEDIIKLLLDDKDKISVIPIVGMGGLGKTTLAQHVFKDDQVEVKFNFKAWVCVGEKFDLLSITKTIYEQNVGPCNKNDLDLIQRELKDKLKGKRFLVVLDDMWNINDAAWESFKNIFQDASEGSKTIVTTRNDNVASVVRTIPKAYKLELMSEEDCWSIFKKHASPSPTSIPHSSLENFRTKIVERCRGLPLAARTLGGLLRTKDNEKEWDEVLKSEIWEFSENDESRILPALRISYHYLPSYLKRCFVFCSLYPKDYKFDRDELVLLWMAGDFLQQLNSGNTLEEIGCKYFNDLVSRSFFLPSNGNENRFVMHDLMHDLATFYAGKFYLRASEHGTATNVDLITRHVSYDVPDSKILHTFDNLKHVRTLLHTCFNKIKGFPKENDSSVPLLLSHLKCLRVFSFECFPHDSLPNSINELIHLRYLDLSEALIVTLPKSLSKLHNLQTLRLRDCERLKMLPSCIQDLVNLRHLDLSKGVFVTLPESLGKLYSLQTLKLRDCLSLQMLPSTMQDLVNLRHLDIRGAESLEEMPAGMNKLKDLKFLSDYIVGRDEEHGISQLGALANLHGSLTIHKLEYVSNSYEASKAKMVDKVHIQDLEFQWSSSGDNNNADFQAEKDKLDKLRPCTELKELKIKGYRGQELSDWLGGSCYRSMTTLTLSECRNCRKLPSLGQLPCLKKLKISELDELCSIGAEFYENDECCQKTPFPSLETLQLVKLSKWQEWNSPQWDAASFPMLKELSIYECPMLTGDLRNHLPASLQSLEIWDCKKLEFSMQQQQESLRSLIIFDSFDSLTSFPLAAFPNLTDLQIIKCDNMKCLEVSQSHNGAVAALPSLSYLVIKLCGNFVSLSTLGKVAPQLWYLEISGCSKVDSFGDGSLPPTLKGLQIVACEKLVRCIASSTVLYGSSLTYLWIVGASDGVESFPREGSLPASLKTLRLWSFLSLEKLDCNGLLHLTSLRYLEIVSCPKLDNIVGENLPASLQELYIYDSPLFGKRCLEQEQQIWPKISHIPTIIVDNRDIREARSSTEEEEESSKGCLKFTKKRSCFKCFPA